MHSTRDRLSSYWGRIKDFLLSPIEEDVGSLTNKQQQLITALEIVRIEQGHVPLIDFNHRSPKDERQFAPHEAERYKERSTAERINARLKMSSADCAFGCGDTIKSWRT